jgi:hypothetical protein
MTMRLCPKGHPITGKNAAPMQSGGRRYRRCRICWNEYHRNYQKKRRRAK